MICILIRFFKYIIITSVHQSRCLPVRPTNHLPSLLQTNVIQTLPLFWLSRISSCRCSVVFLGWGTGTPKDLCLHITRQTANRHENRHQCHVSSSNPLQNVGVETACDLNRAVTLSGKHQACRTSYRSQQLLQKLKFTFNKVYHLRMTKLRLALSCYINPYFGCYLRKSSFLLSLVLLNFLPDAKNSVKRTLKKMRL
jgi:hypothetical protein